MKVITKLTLLFVVVIASLTNKDVIAQPRFQTTKTLALGGAGSAYMNGFEALFINPANIYHRTKNTSVTIGIAPFNIQAGGPLVNINAYNKYFTGGDTYTVNQLQTEIVPAFFKGEESQSFSIQFDAIPIGFTYGNDKFAVAFASRSRVISDFRLNSGWLLLMGGINEDLFGTPSAIDMSTETLALTEISVGFAMPVFSMNADNGFHRLTLGIAPKYLMAVSYAKFDMQSTLEVKSGDFFSHKINYELSANGGINDGIRRYISDKAAGTAKFADLFDSDKKYLDNATDNIASPSNGTGIGFDLGLTYEWEPAFNSDLKFKAALALTDFGKVSFSENAGVFGAAGEFRFDGIEYDTDRIDEEFSGAPEDYFQFIIQDSLAESGYGNITERGSNFSRELPTMVNVGFSVNWKNITYILDIGKGFNDFGVNSTNVSFSNGIEAKFGFFPIRAGFRTGGFAGSSITFGTGLEFKNYEFNIGTLYTPNSDSGFKFGLALSTLVIRI